MTDPNVTGPLGRRQQPSIGQCDYPGCTNTSALGSRYCREHPLGGFGERPDRRIGREQLEQGGDPKHTLRDQINRIEEKVDRILEVIEEGDDDD